MGSMRTWRSGITAVAKVQDFTPTASNSDTFIITLADDFGHSHAITYTSDASGTVQEIVEGLKALADAASVAGYAPWTDVTASEDDTKLTLTADTAGRDFTATTSGTGAFASETVQTACVNPNDWPSAANWLDGTVPVNTDSQTFPAMAADTTMDVNGHDASAILLVDTDIEEGCALNIGSRDVPLKLDTDYFTFNGSGQGFFEVVNCTRLQIGNAVAASSGNSYGLHVYGSSASATMIVDPGSTGAIGIGALADTSVALTALQIHSGTITLGDSLTVSGVTSVSGGTVECSSDIVSLTVTGGTYRQVKNNPTTLNVYGGRVYYNSVDKPTTINLYGGTLDFSEDGRAKDWTAGCTFNWYGGDWDDPNNVVDFGGPNFKIGGLHTIT